MIFFKGVMTGAILSLPFGPIGIYCMEKALLEGEKRAYSSALGMVTVDMIYGIIGFLFINRVEDYILKFETPLKILISLFLILIGSKKFFGKPKIKKLEEDDFTLIQDYFETFILAVLNISSIFVITGIYTFLNIINDSISRLTVIELILGIGIGGGFLWFLTIFIIHHFKKIITVKMLLNISKLSGLIILMFGITTIIFSFYN